MRCTSLKVKRSVTQAALRRFSQAQPNALNAHLAKELEAIRQAGTFKNERVITSAQTSEINISISDKPVLNFCANNYLGLSADPEICNAALETIKTHGFGLSSVRFICGTQDIHKELERRIAEFHGTEDCILFPSCFDANAGVFEAILTKEDAVISDELNHASIIDGIRLCKAQRFRFKHMCVDDLEAKLIEASKTARHKLIVTDGAFSMDGDIAPLKEIKDLADKYGAQIFIDECHATGFLGETGRGTDEHCGVKVDIINSTLGKALGGATGGYTASSKEVVTMMRQKARPYLFSNTLAPSVAGASIAVFDRIADDTTLRDNLAKNTTRFREGMAAQGFQLIGHPSHPIAPIMLGDAKLAADFAEKMLDRGIYVIGFSYPVVPKGKARVRVQISAAHTDEQIDRAIAAFTEVAKELNVL